MAVVSAKAPLQGVGLDERTRNAVNSIVDLQFRNEHRALLTLMEDLSSKLDKISADVERRFEESQNQSKVTENRLEKLENGVREMIQRSKECEGEVKSLKEGMERFSRSMGLEATSAKPILARGGDTDLQQNRGKPLPNATSRKPAHPPCWINISQTPNQTIEAYLAHATKYNKAIKSRWSRFEFIARFIRGLLSEKDRDVLLEHLQKKFASRTTKDGFVEVMCDFSDVGEGLLATGLIVGGGGGGMSGKRGGHDAGMDHGEVYTLHQKRRKTLESQSSNDDEL
ncbi:hypothetical protein BOTCAL_0100g00240 [Botryotinia calthae]|uniref:Uncharacterized protein n=1 Tax=Botryotinia calthae TaxID=38488 RepID=A0A4Y8D8T5_9HELO|nr:hypothetical protein BOTCAL_0100g00240 [Botryotinia calthae]